MDPNQILYDAIAQLNSIAQNLQNYLQGQRVPNPGQVMHVDSNAFLQGQIDAVTAALNAEMSKTAQLMDALARARSQGFNG